MTRKRKPYISYTREFKQEAVRLMDASDRPAAEIARELGVRRNRLYKWKEQLEHREAQRLGRERWAAGPTKKRESERTGHPTTRE